MVQMVLLQLSWVLL